MMRRQSVHEQSTVVFHPELLKVENSLNSVSGRLTSRVMLGWAACSVARPYGSDAEAASAANPSRAEQSRAAGCVLWRQSIKKKTNSHRDCQQMNKWDDARWTGDKRRRATKIWGVDKTLSVHSCFFCFRVRKCRQLRIPLAEFGCWQTQNGKFQGDIKCNLPQIYWDQHLVPSEAWWSLRFPRITWWASKQHLSEAVAHLGRASWVMLIIATLPD